MAATTNRPANFLAPAIILNSPREATFPRRENVRRPASLLGPALPGHGPGVKTLNFPDSPHAFQLPSADRPAAEQLEEY